MEPWAAVPPDPVRDPIKWPLAQRITSITSVANERGDNEMIPGALLEFTLQLRKSPENLYFKVVNLLDYCKLNLMLA